MKNCAAASWGGTFSSRGEQVSAEGIVALGQTEQMLAVAEVYQSDISRVRLEQSARVTGQAFEGELRRDFLRRDFRRDF